MESKAPWERSSSLVGSPCAACPYSFSNLSPPDSGTLCSFPARKQDECELMLQAALLKYFDSLEGQHWDWEMPGQHCFDPSDLSQESLYGAVQGRVNGEAVAQPSLSLPAFPKLLSKHGHHTWAPPLAGRVKMRGTFQMLSCAINSLSMSFEKFQSSLIF